jgi:hypothetical protein
MSARLLLICAFAALLAVPTVAFAATKHGITPTSPKAGKTIAVGKRPTMKGRVNGSGQVYVYVCKSKKRDADGLICTRRPSSAPRSGAAGSASSCRSSTIPSSG